MYLPVYKRIIIYHCFPLNLFILNFSALKTTISIALRIINLKVQRSFFSLLMMWKYWQDAMVQKIFFMWYELSSS